MAPSTPPQPAKTIYRTPADLEPDPGGARFLAACHWGLLPAALAFVSPCFVVLAPVAGAMLSAQASARPGATRFAAFQLFLIEFALAAAVLLGQFVVQIIDLPIAVATGAVSVAAVAIGVAGLLRARAAQPLWIPGFSALVFRLAFKGLESIAPPEPEPADPAE